MRKRRLYGDLEANGLLDTVTKLWCGVFVDIDTGEEFRFHSGKKGWEYEMFEFLSEAKSLGFHNAYGYDFPMLKKLYGWEFEGERFDTLVLSRLVYADLRDRRGSPAFVYRSPHSIESWGYRFGRLKPEHEDWSKFTPEMLHRCAEDVAIGLQLVQNIEEKIEKEGWGRAAKTVNRLFEILNEQERYGWTFDVDHAHKCLRVLTRWIDRIANAVAPQLPIVMEVEEGTNPVAQRPAKGHYKYVTAPFLKSGEYNSNVIKWADKVGLCLDDRPIWGPYSRISFRTLDLDKREEIIKFLLDSGWVPQEWNTSDKTGERTSPKMSYKDPFIGVEGKLGQLVARRVQCKHRYSVVKGLLGRVREDGRVAARVTGIASTGRMKHADVVNIPNSEAFFGKWMRKLFIVKEGWTIVGTDAASCQNRCLAARVGNDDFTKTLLEGKKEDETTIHHLNVKALKKLAGIDVSYGTAKNLQYGFMFGASDYKLGSMVGGGKKEGELIRAALLSNVPGLEQIIEELKAEWQSTGRPRMNKWGKIEYTHGKVKGIDGRPILIESEHTLLVYMLQSDEAIIMCEALVSAIDKLESLGYSWYKDFGLLAFMHDEFQIECRPEISDTIAEISEQAIYEAGKSLGSLCDHKGEADKGTNWYETH